MQSVTIMGSATRSDIEAELNRQRVSTTNLSRDLGRLVTSGFASKHDHGLDAVYTITELGKRAL